MMMETVINILPLSHRHDVGKILQRVMDGISQFARARKWHGRRVAFSMRFDSENNVLNFGGGKHRLPDSAIRFISLDMDYEHRHDVNAVQQWASQFSRLVIVADAQELLQNPELRHAVTARRLAMQERYFDVSLMLMDVDGIMDIEDTGVYATTYIGVSAAFGGKPYNGSKLKKVYQEQWDEVYSLGLAQDLQLYIRRNSKRTVYLPLMLICHSDNYYQMGFQELLLSCINHAVEPQSLELTNVSTLNTSSTMETFNFNTESNGRKKSDKRCNGRYIRLAVIGLTSSGKTYLLEDLVASLQKFGYKCSISKSMPLYRPSAATFLNQVADYNDGIWQTEVYACRPTNQYLTVYNKDGQKFLLEFVDVPGDVVTRDSITEFQAILSALSESTEPMFRETIWTRGKKHIIKTVEFVGYGSQQPSLEENKTDDDDIKLRGGDSDDQSPLTPNQGAGSGVLTQGFRTLSYETDNDAIINELTRQRYKPVSNTKSRLKSLIRFSKKNQEDDTLISGQYLLGHLQDYVTDTVINAIIAAWDALGIDQCLSTSGLRLTETYNGKLNTTDSNKARFEKVYKNHFYFHYYTFYATDVVICDKCAVPFDHLNYDKDGKPKQTILSANERYEALDKMTTNNWYMMNALSSLLGHPSASKKHIYLAFRGVDSFMVENCFKILKQRGCPANMLYSLFVLHLFASFKSNDADEYNEYDVDGFADAITPFAEGSDFLDAIHSTCGDVGPAAHLSEKLLDEYVLGLHSKFINDHPSTYFLTSNFGLSEHILDRIERFKSLPGACPVPTDDTSFAGKLDFLLPPHVYFTSSAIDNDFNICGHSPDSVRRFTGKARHEGNRLCFGTRNLLADILLAHGIDNTGETIGRLLSYCYQSSEK